MFLSVLLLYIQILYNNNPVIYVTTPKMFCPFGLSKKGFPITGTRNRSGATATGGELVFVSGTMDKKIRAFDSSIGIELDDEGVSQIKKRLQSLRQSDNIEKLRHDYVHTENLDDIWKLSEKIKAKKVKS